MLKSEYHISKMDCPSEENMIRVKLEGISEIEKLEFDLENRDLFVYHSSENNEITAQLHALDLGSVHRSTVHTASTAVNGEDSRSESSMLRAVLLINLSFFIIEMTTGLVSRSMGLVADSLDMLADSFVYGLSLWAVGSSLTRKKRVATLSGYFQLTLAVVGLAEVIRRFISGEAMPDFRMMIGISVFALTANAVCLYLLQKSKSKEAHIKASMIFTSNDVIINAGVILAGILVFLTESRYPDLIIGSVVFLIVVRGAFRILRLGR